MIKIIDSENYYLYLLERVGIEYVEERAYSFLFHELFSTEFFWIEKMDENRALDGTDLRRQYSEDSGEELVELGPCSFLEMMVALSIRCDEELMKSGDEDNSRIWFWDMICNLGLEKYDNSKWNPMAVKRILKNVMFRRFEPNGVGGLFPLKSPKLDQRKVEIWYQLNAWLEENYE